MDEVGDTFREDRIGRLARRFNSIRSGVLIGTRGLKHSDAEEVRCAAQDILRDAETILREVEAL